MESFIPKPVSSSAVQPLIPIIIIKKRFLYLNTFLTLTFLRNFSLFHINGICSRNTLLPGFGALGLIRLAAVSESSYLQENQVVPTVHKRDAASTPITSVQSVVLSSGICIYII